MNTPVAQVTEVKVKIVESKKPNLRINTNYYYKVKSIVVEIYTADTVLCSSMLSSYTATEFSASNLKPSQKERRQSNLSRQASSSSSEDGSEDDEIWTFSNSISARLESTPELPLKDSQ